MLAREARMEVVSLAHGAGGAESQALLEEVFSKLFKLKKVADGVGLDDMDDSASIPVGDDLHVAVKVDSYTVKPIFFPGGDIGKLAITGTVNDLVVFGAKPLAILDAMVVEEGFPLDELKKILSSMRAVAEAENVALIGGDFKVMPRGSIDKVVISTVGVGLVHKKRILLDSNLRPGDKLIISGSIGEHGAAILAAQLDIQSSIISDCSTLTKVMEAALSIGGVHAANDPTRGGLAMALNNMARKSGLSIIVEEDKIPVKDEVRALAEMAGIDPLALACEGRALLAVEAGKAEEVLEAIRKVSPDASIIGEAVKLKEGYVFMKTVVGGLRVVEPPRGELVPRIC